MTGGSGNYPPHISDSEWARGLSDEEEERDYDEAPLPRGRDEI